ncbi:MAG: UPF0182 family protein [Cyanophyceae cyanobacterium]
MKFGQRAIALIALTVLIGLSLVNTLIHLLTESWWFETVGFADVFWTRLTWQAITWVGTFAIYAVFLWGNYQLALNLTRERAFTYLKGTEFEPYSKFIANAVALIIIFVSSLGAAQASAADWELILKFLNGTNFDVTEPIYGLDVGFYLFKLPLFERAYGWLLSLFAIALVLSAGVYVLKQRISLDYRFINSISGRVKTHLSVLLAAIALLIAFDFWLERYELLYSTEGVVFGAGYTDTHARLLAYWVMFFLALLLGTLFILAVWLNNFSLPVYGVALYLVALILVNGVYPGFQQQFVVEPNELAKERPYIENNLEFTRSAYSLDNIPTEDYPAAAQLDSQDLQENQSTVRNIRLWDYRPLLSTYRQLQEIRLYYHFNDVDVDRYTLDGNYRQVMLAPRELSYEQVPQQAQTWVNQRLKYTHGYGLVMSPVNRVTPQGLPELFIKNIPPASAVDLEIDEPAIYYGEDTNTYIFTGTSTPEFDYPRGDENAFTNYAGEGGVPMPSLWHRLAYAYDFSSLKILISNYFTDTSRVHYYRNIRERVSHVAPFLRFDRDPYIAVVDGKLYWIVDAYTTSDRYPYSKPVAQSDNAGEAVQAVGEINYIRNSVKVVVDAFNGTMQFVAMDEDEPVMATYPKILPSLLTSQADIPPEIQAHFRYPLDFFKIQSQMFLAYHMNDPQVFYNQEDLWRFPTELYEGNQQRMEPYYVIVQLPEESQEEFILILPFTPVNKDNMIAWMAARSDGANYGKLLLYEFPKQELVYGPSQIEARIDQTPDISQQLTLWSQEGSRVIRGNLLVIPVEDSLLYVEPVYLRAEQGELPELKRVIVAYDKDVVMTPTLEESLATIFEGLTVEESPPSPTATAPSTPDASIAESALAAYERGQEALRQGNWSEYGRYQQELRNLLQQLQTE